MPANPSAGQLPAPSQFSGGSQTPLPLRQSVAALAKSSSGQSAEVPVQVSCGSQMPLPARQSVPAAPKQLSSASSHTLQMLLPTQGSPALPQVPETHTSGPLQNSPSSAQSLLSVHSTTSVGSDAELSPRSVSFSSWVTETLLQRSSVPSQGSACSVPAVGAVPLTETVIWIITLPPDAIDAMLHVTMPAACMQPPSSLT